MDTNMDSDPLASKDTHLESDTNPHTQLSGSTLSTPALPPLISYTKPGLKKNTVNIAEEEWEKVEKVEEAEKVDKTSLLRAAMAKRFQDMVDDSTDDRMDGKVFIVYERLGDFQWLPGKGDGEFLRRIKHWRLIIQLGFDAFTLEFLENSIVSYQGVLLVSPYDQGASDKATPYLVGHLKGLSTEVLYKWIQDQSEIWKEYNLLTNNCQHFVHEFLAHFEEKGYLTRTGHLAAVNQKHEQPQSEQQEQEEQYRNQKVFKNARPEDPRPMQDQSPHQKQHQLHLHQQYPDQHQNQQQDQNLQYLQQREQQSMNNYQSQQFEQIGHSFGSGARARSSSPLSNWIPSIEKVGRFIGDMGYKSKSFILPPPKGEEI